MEDGRRSRQFAAPELEDFDPAEIPLGRDLTDCVLGFLHERVTPVAQWVAWSGGDPLVVLSVIAQTLRSIADGLDHHEIPD